MNKHQLKKRMSRAIDLTGAIADFDSDRDFFELVEEKKSLFNGFNVIYSSTRYVDTFNTVDLDKIEDQCQTLSKYFSGTCLYFYSDEIFNFHDEGKSVFFPVDYSLSFDSNVAERFRIWRKGKSLGSDWPKFENLVRFIKNNKFNFDYSFFIIENINDAMNPTNDRVFCSLAALKLFDTLIYDKNKFDDRKPIFHEKDESAYRRAIETMHSFSRPKVLDSFTIRRQGVYCLLLKATLLNLDKKKTIAEKCSELFDFSLDVLGKYAKAEIYTCWKFFKYAKSLNFFSPMLQLSEKSIGRIRGMSWDIFSYRYQETISTNQENGMFYIPFFVSFDNKYMELARACPIRAQVIDHIGGRIFTVYEDEKDYQSDIYEYLNSMQLSKLSNVDDKFTRINKKYNQKKVLGKIDEFEKAIQSIVNKRVHGISRYAPSP